MDKAEQEQLLALARSRQLTPGTARRLFNLKDYGIDGALAENPSTPHPVLKKLVDRGNLMVLATILQRQNLTEELMLLVWKARGDGLAANFLAFQGLPIEILRAMAEETQQFFGEALSGRSDLPEAMLVDLSHGRLTVKRGAAKNRMLPVWRMVEMAQSENPGDRSSVSRNPALPQEWREKSSRDLVPGVRMGVAANSSRSYEEELRLAFDAYPGICLALLDDPATDIRIGWMMASLPKGSQDKPGLWQRRAGELAIKKNDLGLRDWTRRRLEGEAHITPNGLVREWKGVRREWLCPQPEVIGQLQNIVLDHDLRVMGWWEPGFENAKGERWFLVTHYAPKLASGEDHSISGGEPKSVLTKTGWITTEPGFSGLFLPMVGRLGNREAGVDGTEVGGEKIELLQGIWEVNFSGEEVFLASRLMVLEKGPAPQLPNLQRGFEPNNGPLVATGLLLSEEHTFSVLWGNQNGDPVGWEAVLNWEAAKSIEAKGTPKPGRLAIKDELWERFEKTLRSAYSQREI